MKKSGKSILALVLIVVFSCAALLGCGLTETKERQSSGSNTKLATNSDSEVGTESEAGSEAEELDKEDANFSITMLDVGQGLCLLIECNGKYMIYDGGGRDTSSKVVAQLKELGITELDYMVASHYDEDHISGLVGVLNTTAVKEMICPDYETDTSIYQSLMSKIQEKAVEVVHPEAGDTFLLDDAEITVLGPSNYEHEEENDNSLVLRIDYGDFSVLVSGDASEAAEAEMLEAGVIEPVDLYVVAHHGSAYSTSEAFVEAMAPAYAFLSVGVNNDYSHPAQETLDVLAENGVGLFRTDDQGEVTCYANEETYWFSTEPTENWKNGSEMSVANSDGSDADGTGSGSADASETDGTVVGGADTTTEVAMDYVLNTNTMKFHYPWCTAVDNISEHNRQDVNATRSEIIGEGYESCGICHP